MRRIGIIVLGITKFDCSAMQQLESAVSYEYRPHLSKRLVNDVTMHLGWHFVLYSTLFTALPFLRPSVWEQADKQKCPAVRQQKKLFARNKAQRKLNYKTF